MFDVTGPLLIVVLLGVCSFLPLRSYFVASNDSVPLEVTDSETTAFVEVSKIPEDSVSSQHCLTNFRAEIEAAFAPRPTDSILIRHHDALIAAELEKRLAELTV